MWPQWCRAWQITRNPDISNLRTLSCSRANVHPWSQSPFSDTSFWKPQTCFVSTNWLILKISYKQPYSVLSVSSLFNLACFQGSCWNVYQPVLLSFLWSGNILLNTVICLFMFFVVRVHVCCLCIDTCMHGGRVWTRRHTRMPATDVFLTCFPI